MWNLSGQGFWTLIAGYLEFYTRIVKPLAHQARERNDDFVRVYGAVFNRLVAEFTEGFVTADFKVDWHALVKFNSESHV